MIDPMRDTKSLTMRNNCLLPVAWRITGLESLGDDFSLSQDQGIIDSKSEFSVQMNFKAMRQVNLRKYIRLENPDKQQNPPMWVQEIVAIVKVHDAENVLGIVQTENILVLAEAYDVALDISFPK
eukprot:g30152.t1